MLDAARATRLRCAALLLLVIAPGCGETPVPDARPLVAVSIPPLVWFVERLGGDELRVRAMLPAGANPHSFEPDLRMLKEVAGAVAWVEIGHPGLPFEQVAVGALLADRGEIAVIRAADDAARGEPDPHLWLSPRAARGIALRIAEGLAVALPAQATAIRERRGALDAEIAALDRELGERLAPLRGRAFLSYHPDWTGFAKDYGLRQLVLERGHREPDARALGDQIEVARRERVRVLFVQPQFSRQSAELVAAEIGARVASIDPLGRDWPGTLRAMTDALVESFAP